MDKAQGLFLYTSLLAQHLEEMKTTQDKDDKDNEKESKEKLLDFKDLPGLPTGLSGLPTGLSAVYEENFERMVHSSRQDWDEHYSPLIALIVAAREPLPTVARQVRSLFPSYFLSSLFSSLFRLLSVAC